MVAKTQHHTRSECPVACALDMFGDHWSLLIIHFMIFLNLHEYKDFLARPEKISTGILSDRLAKLEAAHIIASIDHPHNKRRKLYYLTPKGKDLAHVLIAIIQWSCAHLSDIDIPHDKRAMIKNDPQGFVKLALKTIEDWEKEYLLRA